MVLSLIAALAVSTTQASDDLKKLSFMEGDWTSTERSTVGGKEVTFTLTGTNRWILDGSCLQIDESFELPELGKVSNHILYMFDANRKKYIGYWFSNQAPIPVDFEGAWSGKKLILTDSSDRARITYEPLSEGRFRAMLEQKVNGKWTTTTDADYRRATLK